MRRWHFIALNMRYIIAEDRIPTIIQSFVTNMAAPMSMRKGVLVGSSMKHSVILDVLFEICFRILSTYTALLQQTIQHLRILMTNSACLPQFRFRVLTTFRDSSACWNFRPSSARLRANSTTTEDCCSSWRSSCYAAVSAVRTLCSAAVPVSSHSVLWSHSFLVSYMADVVLIQRIAGMVACALRSDISEKTYVVFLRNEYVRVVGFEMRRKMPTRPMSKDGTHEERVPPACDCLCPNMALTKNEFFQRATFSGIFYDLSSSSNFLLRVSSSPLFSEELSFVRNDSVARSVLLPSNL